MVQQFHQLMTQSRTCGAQRFVAAGNLLSTGLLLRTLTPLLQFDQCKPMIDKLSGASARNVEGCAFLRRAEDMAFDLNKSCADVRLGGNAQQRVRPCSALDRPRND
jgi:hypothetical protein